jgi:hypothetical protein
MWKKISSEGKITNKVYLYPSIRIKKGTFLGGGPVMVGIMMHITGETAA